jgi:hypothetical protein
VLHELVELVLERFDGMKCHAGQGNRQFLANR